MHDQSSGFTMILGGVDRSADFRRTPDSGPRVTAALLAVIAVLTLTTGWLASVALTPQAAAAAPAADRNPAPPTEPVVYPY